MSGARPARAYAARRTRTVEPLARLTTVRRAGPSVARRTTIWVAGGRASAFVRIVLIPSTGGVMRRTLFGRRHPGAYCT